MQYLGTIALYSWLADLVPLQIRGRFFGLRERWLVAGEAAAAIACGLFAESWQSMHPKSIALDRLRDSRRTRGDVHAGGARADLAHAPA